MRNWVWESDTWHCRRKAIFFTLAKDQMWAAGRSCACKGPGLFVVLRCAGGCWGTFCTRMQCVSYVSHRTLLIHEVGYHRQTTWSYFGERTIWSWFVNRANVSTLLTWLPPDPVCISNCEALAGGNISKLDVAYLWFSWLTFPKTYYVGFSSNQAESPS